MNNLFKISLNDNGQYVIDGRAFLKYIGVKNKFESWFYVYQIEFGFIENKDFWIEYDLVQKKMKNILISISVARFLTRLLRNEKELSTWICLLEFEKSHDIPDQTQRFFEFFEKLNKKQIKNIIEEDSFSDIIYCKEIAYERIHTNMTGNTLLRDFINRITVPREYTKNIYISLRKNHILLTRKPFFNRPSKKYLDKKYLKLRKRKYIDINGDKVESNTAEVTPLGKPWLVDRLIEWDLIDVSRVLKKY
ncbi:hypothetical protein HN451_02035 [archaeon]|jgi:phage anti-repressor protein|nr:hypothetical protein [archaeon]